MSKNPPSNNRLSFRPSLEMFGHTEMAELTSRYGEKYPDLSQTALVFTIMRELATGTHQLVKVGEDPVAVAPRAPMNGEFTGLGFDKRGVMIDTTRLEQIYHQIVAHNEALWEGCEDADPRLIPVCGRRLVSMSQSAFKKVSNNGINQGRIADWFKANQKLVDRYNKREG